MAKKSNLAQVEQRIRIVYELLLSDTPYVDVVRHGSQEWGVSRRMIDKYAQKARLLIFEEAAQMRQNAMEKHLAQRALLRYKALKDGDKRLAFEILKDESKLLGMYAPDKTHATNIDVNLSELTDEQLSRLAAGEDIAKILADG